MNFGEPPPIKNDGPSMHDLVAADIAARKEFGLKKYGTPLQAHNGRDALMDAYEETLDLIVYLRQAIEERGDTRHRVVRPIEPSLMRSVPWTTVACIHLSLWFVAVTLGYVIVNLWFS